MRRPVNSKSLDGQRKDEACVPIVSLTSTVFHSPGDEAAMFVWLRDIGGVQRYWGVGRTLFISVVSRPSRETVRELAALFLRYRATPEELDALPKLTERSKRPVAGKRRASR